MAMGVIVNFTARTVTDFNNVTGGVRSSMSSMWRPSAQSLRMDHSSAPDWLLV
jgi:hypothetical protein